MNVLKCFTLLGQQSFSPSCCQWPMPSVHLAETKYFHFHKHDWYGFVKLQNILVSCLQHEAMK